jgi:hypothetical protein
MSISEPKLDFFLPETHSSKLLAVSDYSIYPEGYTVTLPYLEITPPGWDKVLFTFVARGTQVYDSNTLGITNGCEPIPLPDGIYTIKYSINPSYKYFVEKNIFLVNGLYEKWDECWVKAHLSCGINRTTMQVLDGIECYIEGAVALANKCMTKAAYDLYNQANVLLNCYLNHL